MSIKDQIFVAMEPFLENHRADWNATDLASLLASATGLDLHLFRDTELSESMIPIHSVENLETPADLPEPEEVAQSVIKEGRIELNSGKVAVVPDSVGRLWMIGRIGEFLAVQGPFLDDRSAALQSRSPLIQSYYRRLPVLERRQMVALGRILLALGQSHPSGEAVNLPRLEPHIVHDPATEDRLMEDEKIIEDRYRAEDAVIAAVSAGDKETLRRLLGHGQRDFDFRDRLPDNPVRLQKNISVVLNTILRQAARQGGLPPVSVHGLSERFAILIERAGSAESLDGIQNEMLEAYVDAVRHYGQSSRSRPVRRALAAINRNLGESFNLRDLAQEAGCHPTHLSRLFKAETGRTLSAYIRFRRMEEAAWLLRSQGLSVRDAALMVGYQDAGAFTRAFRREMGRNPSVYRNAGSL